MSNEVRLRVVVEDKATKALNDIGKVAAGVFGGAVALRAFDAFTNGLKSLTVGAVQAASGFEENLNKVRVVFGQSSKEIESFSRSASINLGLSESAALGAAGTFGNLFTAMKLSRPVASEMSQGIVKLAADLASFNNIKPEEALEKLRAGLVGEIEPLRSVGVNLTAASVAARAMKMGLAESEKALTPAAKAQAAYAIILEQTTTAQGDFARTSGGLANQSRTLRATFEDLKVTIGQGLEPVVNRVFGYILRVMQRRTFQDGVQDWTTKIKEFVSAFERGFSLIVIPALRWIVDNKAVLVAAITAIGLAFAWAHPGGALLVGLGAAVTLLGILQKEGGQSRLASLYEQQTSLRREVGLHGDEEFFGGETPRSGAMGRAWSHLQQVNKEIEKLEDLEGKGALGAIGNFAGSLEMVNFGIQEQLGLNKDLAAGMEDLSGGIDDTAGATKKATENFKKFTDFLDEGMSALASAAGAIFGRPTREEATLQLQLAEVERQITGLGIASGPAVEARKRQIEHIESVIGRLEIDKANARSDRQREAVEQEIADREAQIDRLNKANDSLLEPYEKLREQLQNQLTLMEQDNRVQQLQLTLADNTLLSELNQYNMTQDLITQTGRVTGAYKDLADRFGLSIIPGFDELMARVWTLSEVLSVVLGGGSASPADLNAALRARGAI